MCAPVQFTSCPAVGDSPAQKALKEGRGGQSIFLYWTNRHLKNKSVPHWFHASGAFWLWNDTKNTGSGAGTPDLKPACSQRAGWPRDISSSVRWRQLPGASGRVVEMLEKSSSLDVSEQDEMLLNLSSGIFVFNITVLLRSHTIYPLQTFNWTVFSIFTRFCNRHSLVLEKFQKGTQWLLAITSDSSHSPPPPSPFPLISS